MNEEMRNFEKYSKKINNVDNESIYCEFGCSSPISFFTSEGIKTIMPGKSYDKELNEI